MKLWVTLEGRDAEVEFHTEGERLVLEVEGRRLEADFHRLPDGEVYSLIVNGRSHEVRVAAPPLAGAGSGSVALVVTLAGTTFPVEVRHPIEKVLQAVRRASAAQSVETVQAPMPGLLVAYRVQAGERVAAGQAVAVVEAMKMQNELTARHGGVVTELLVAERATVSAGQALLRIHPEGA
jgi:biotin carboxyl carrier protein